MKNPPMVHPAIPPAPKSKQISEGLLQFYAREEIVTIPVGKALLGGGVVATEDVGIVTVDVGVIDWIEVKVVKPDSVEYTVSVTFATEKQPT